MLEHKENSVCGVEFESHTIRLFVITLPKTKIIKYPFFMQYTSFEVRERVIEKNWASLCSFSAMRITFSGLN